MLLPEAVGFLNQNTQSRSEIPPEEFPRGSSEAPKSAEATAITPIHPGELDNQIWLLKILHTLDTAHG